MLDGGRGAVSVLYGTLVFVAGEFESVATGAGTVAVPDPSEVMDAKALQRQAAATKEKKSTLMSDGSAIRFCFANELQTSCCAVKRIDR